MAELGKPPPAGSAGFWPALRARTPALPLIAGIAPRQRIRIGICSPPPRRCCFRSLIGNDADIDCGGQRLAFAALALGLNIVVGFAGLLDLGYAAFFAIGAYAYGILELVAAAAGMDRVLGAVPMARPGRAATIRRPATSSHFRCRSG